MRALPPTVSNHSLFYRPWLTCTILVSTNNTTQGELSSAAGMEARIWRACLLVSLVGLVALNFSPASAAEEEGEKVLTLDKSNFSEVVSRHDFIVVEFYAPWCGHCKSLAPEYEKAASILSSHEPPIALAKIDANDEENKELASEFEVQGFPTIKILRNGGKNVQMYKGPRDADGIVDYLKKQAGPASAEIKSVDDATRLIDEKKIFIVGVFPKLSGDEFDNFMTLAEKLRSDYDIGHTLDAKFLPRGEPVDKPTLRLLKPFDELFVDFQDFKVDAMEKFVKEASVPLVTLWNSDPINHPYVNKFFEHSNDKAMLFVNFSEGLDSFQTKFKDVASTFKGKNISFLLGDVETSQGAFQYFGLKEEQAPLLIILNAAGQKYLSPKVDPDQIAQWTKEYADGILKPYIKSQTIPEVNDEPVKVVVADNFQDIVFSSGKNVLLEFYAPWCGHCKKLAPILEEVATSFENDPDVIIAKFDATANDISNDSFDVQGYPTLYFRSSSGNMLPYDGERTKEDLIDFIQKNRDKAAESEISTTSSESVNADSVKDEL